ncbi:MAG: hypothetical protein EOO07_16760 [Chitinophagaceae bacterium]|nr:MAG: hypothetical protein EOO07_16760 [Chitinophagaceae bacterium]
MLTWIIEKNENRISHITRSAETSENGVRHCVEAAVDKAISLFKTNIQDDSLYLLFDWNLFEAKLNIIITNASKNNDSAESVCCVFPSLAIELSRESDEQRENYTESLKFWLHDYLAICPAFLNYSLVAIFNSGSRQNTELL